MLALSYKLILSQLNSSLRLSHKRKLQRQVDTGHANGRLTESLAHFLVPLNQLNPVPKQTLQTKDRKWWNLPLADCKKKCLVWKGGKLYLKTDTEQKWNQLLMKMTKNIFDVHISCRRKQDRLVSSTLVRLFMSMLCSKRVDTWVCDIFLLRQMF